MNVILQLEITTIRGTALLLSIRKTQNHWTIAMSVYIYVDLSCFETKRWKLMLSSLSWHNDQIHGRQQGFSDTVRKHKMLRKIKGLSKEKEEKEVMLV